MEKETYIGDGVYASFDGYQIWLRTVRDDAEHMIAIDHRTFEALYQYGHSWGFKVKDIK